MTATVQVTPGEASPTPRFQPIKIKWRRFPRRGRKLWSNTFKKANAYAIVGGKETGKSSLAETIAAHYLDTGGKVIDIFGSRDNEALGWVKGYPEKKILFLKGNSVEIDCNCGQVLNTADVTIEQLERYDIIISVAAFYNSLNEEWICLGKLMDHLWKRNHWRKPWCLLIREASNLIYSRLSLGDQQQAAKNHLIFVMREMRHCGYALIVDTLRLYGIDIDVRSLADFTFFKASGVEWLPKAVRFLYNCFSPESMMLMQKKGFVILSRYGPYGVGAFKMPPWHKQEHEDLMADLDIRPEYKEIPREGKQGAAVGDYEHIRIVKGRMEADEEHRAMGRLAVHLGRSSGTIFRHINEHNSMVSTVGECEKCARANGQYKKTLIE